MARIAAALPIAYKLHTTPPEQRKPLFTLGVALLALSDKFDGISARRAGPTEFGKWLDQTADKVFVAPSLWVLGRNGEIAPQHFPLKLARDAAVTGMRALAEARGIDVPVLETARYKTTTEMGALVLAASPLAANRSWLEAGMKAATGLSLLTAAQYGLNYVHDVRQQGAAA